MKVQCYIGYRWLVNVSHPKITPSPPKKNRICVTDTIIVCSSSNKEKKFIRMCTCYTCEVFTKQDQFYRVLHIFICTYIHYADAVYFGKLLDLLSTFDLILCRGAGGNDNVGRESSRWHLSRIIMEREHILQFRRFTLMWCFCIVFFFFFAVYCTASRKKCKNVFYNFVLIHTRTHRVDMIDCGDNGEMVMD